MEFDIKIKTALTEELTVNIGSEEDIQEQIREHYEGEEIEFNEDTDLEFTIIDYCDLEQYPNLQKDLEGLADYNGYYTDDLDLLEAARTCDITFDNIDEAYTGKYDSDEDFAEQFCTDCGDIPKDIPNYIYIDWERTARDIMYDYTTDNGYYFRIF